MSRCGVRSVCAILYACRSASRRSTCSITPNFLNPLARDRLGDLNFGRSTQMANRGFGGMQGPALQQFYESGGPRSMQVSLRLEF